MGVIFLVVIGVLVGFQVSRIVFCFIFVIKGFDWGNLGGIKNKVVVIFRKIVNFFIICNNYYYSKLKIEMN